MLDIETRVQQQAFVAAAVTGAGTAVLAARFLVPAFAPMMYVVAGMVVVLGGAGWQVAIKRRPPSWQLLGIGAGAFAATAAIIWSIAPRAGNVRLAPARLPDLLISVPRDTKDGNVAGELFDRDGEIEMGGPDGLRLAVAIVWRTGALPRADDVAAVRAALGDRSGDEVAVTDDPGLSLAQEHHSYAVRAEGLDGIATTFACDDHFYVVLTVGEDAATLHRRIVDSAECGKGR
jgi:hypothetical protein